MQQPTEAPPAPPAPPQAPEPPRASWNDLKEKFNFHLHELQKLIREMDVDGVPNEEAVKAYAEMKYHKKIAKMMNRGFNPAWFAHPPPQPWHQQYGAREGPSQFGPRDCPRFMGPPHPAMFGHPWAAMPQCAHPCGPLQWDPKWYKMKHHHGHCKHEERDRRRGERDCRREERHCRREERHCKRGDREGHHSRRRGKDCGSDEEWARKFYKMQRKMQQFGPHIFAESSSSSTETEEPKTN